MTRVAGRYSSAVLVASVGLALSSCAGDVHNPYPEAQQLAAEATQRVCDVLETCCLAENFPYEEQGCKDARASSILQYFDGQVFLGAELDTEAAKRCLDAIGKVSEGCPAHRVSGELPDACAWVFKGTVPLGGECDPSHGCATTPDAPLRCQREYDGRQNPINPGVCVADTKLVAVHGSLGEDCVSTCIGDQCLSTGPEITCYSSDGLVCGAESKQCEPQAVSGEDCRGTGDCVSGTYCADSKCTPMRPLGDPCTEQEQCESQYCTGSCELLPRASADLCLGSKTPSFPPPGTGGRAGTGSMGTGGRAGTGPTAAGGRAAN